MMRDRFHISRHAARRMNQRGVRQKSLYSLIGNADSEVDVGDGLVALRVSAAKARAMNLGDKIHRFAAIISADNTGCKCDSGT